MLAAHTYKPGGWRLQVDVITTWRLGRLSNHDVNAKENVSLKVTSSR